MKNGGYENMKNTTKIFVLSVSLLIIVTAFFPILNSKPNTLDKQNFNNFLDINKNKSAEIILYQYFENGTIEKNVKEIPINDALHFTQDLQTFNSGSLVEKFHDINRLYYREQITPQNRVFPSSLKTMNTYDKNTLINNIYKNLLSQNSNDGLMPNFLCKLKFKLLGLGFVLGTHGIVPIGADIFGIFGGLGSIDATDGFLDDQHKSGFIIGGFIGFIGSLVLVIIPFFPGPFISADGTAVVSLWI